jgi:glutamine amidotransferase
MGWNQIEPTFAHPLLAKIKPGDFAYFAHSYTCVPKYEDHVLARTDYEDYFVSAIATNNIFGIQFHPEKSQRVGLQILRNFADIVAEAVGQPA